MVTTSSAILFVIFALSFRESFVVDQSIDEILSARDLLEDNEGIYDGKIEVRDFE